MELARSALEAGDEPFGSILVDGDGTTRYQDRNQVKDGDATQHPEFAIARWAVDLYEPGRACPRNGLHLRRTLPDVRGGARLGGPHCLRHLVGPVE